MSDSGRFLNQCEHGNRRYECPSCQAEALQRENATLRALLVRAAEALGPFATAAAGLDASAADYHRLRLFGALTDATVGHCRQAAAARAAIQEVTQAK